MLQLKRQLQQKKAKCSLRQFRGVPSDLVPLRLASQIETGSFY